MAGQVLDGKRELTQDYYNKLSQYFCWFRLLDISL
jgi:hypothetical protein